MTLPQNLIIYSEVPFPKQDVVPIDIVLDRFLESSTVAAPQQKTLYVDNSHA